MFEGRSRGLTRNKANGEGSLTKYKDGRRAPQRRFAQAGAGARSARRQRSGAPPVGAGSPAAAPGEGSLACRDAATATMRSAAYGPGDGCDPGDLSALDRRSGGRCTPFWRSSSARPATLRRRSWSGPAGYPLGGRGAWGSAGAVGACGALDGLEYEQPFGRAYVRFVRHAARREKRNRRREHRMT
jgi:hypothetical protein